MASKTARIDDFDVDKIAVAVDQHAKEMTGLDGRLAKLESKVGTNDGLAETMETACSKAVKMREVFSAEFLRMLEKEDKIKDAITILVNQADRNWLLSYFKKLGFTVWTLIVLIGGYGIHALIDALVKAQLPHG